MYRFMPTAPPPPEDEDEDNEGDDPDKEGDNEEQVVEEEKAEDVPPVEGGDDEPGMWEETFKSHSDSKPYGGWGVPAVLGTVLHYNHVIYQLRLLELILLSFFFCVTCILQCSLLVLVSAFEDIQP